MDRIDLVASECDPWELVDEELDGATTFAVRASPWIPYTPPPGALKRRS